MKKYRDEEEMKEMKKKSYLYHHQNVK